MCARKKGISTRQIQRMLKCSMKTAWFLTHRIREAMKDGSPGSLGGEGKETVYSLVEGDGRVRSMHVASVTASNLRPILVGQTDE